VRRQLERTNRELAGEIRQRRRAETDLRSLVAHLPALLCRVDGQGRVVYADGRGLARLHLTAGQLVGKTLDEMFQGVLGGKTFAEAMAEGQNIRFSYLGVSLEGFFTPVDEGLGEGEAERVALFIDVTEQALMLSKMSGYAGDLERSNAELEQFAYVASHDLKEPIRSVSGFLNLALRQGDKDLDPLVLDCIVQARDAAGRMQTLVTDLLAYARVGRQKREPQEVDANGLMLLVNRDLRGALEQAGAELTWGELPRVVADPTQLLQVLQNLVNNAVKFQDMARVPRVQVTAKRMAGGWRFEVKDNGIGIAVENQRRIFQIFQRLHTREEYPGTGIGLALCRRIVENWGGRLGVESVVGEGSSFWFTIPTDDTSPTQPIRKGSA
jgi:signal transduction histidine kinase